MNKKILIISGSPRKNGDGIKVLKEFEFILKKDIEISCEYLFINDYNIDTCRGCLICQKLDGYKCPIKDDMKIIIEKLNEADGFIFISPVYMMMISAQMKLFFDRLSFLVHRPVHIGKPAILLSTYSFGGGKNSLRYMKIPVSHMGISVIDGIGISSIAYKNKVDYKEKKIKRLNNATKKYIDILTSLDKPAPSIKQLFMFNLWKNMTPSHKKEYPGDFNFWNDNKLLYKKYFYTTKINPILGLIIPFITKKAVKLLNKKIGLY